MGKTGVYGLTFGRGRYWRRLRGVSAEARSADLFEYDVPVTLSVALEQATVTITLGEGRIFHRGAAPLSGP